MKELFNLLEKKEHKFLWIMGIFMGISFLFLVIIAQGERNSYFDSQVELRSIQKSAEKAEKESKEKKMEWLQWKDARADFKELKNKYLYRERDLVKDLRMDLQAILNQTGVEYSQIKYTYGYDKDAKISEVTITFNMKGSYMALKKLIHEIEQFPKFLALDRITFSDIDSQTGILSLRISLTGYYAN
ncbi:MAG TPA: hypothetical protein ENN58_02855 [bacterium]|nr:hypothetical protein [bacterium]